MANITYRESTNPSIPGVTLAKASPLTNIEVDANFKALNDDVQTRATTSSVTLALASKASLESPTFTGTVVLPNTIVIGGVASAFDSKASLESPTFTGTVVLPNTTTIGDISGSELAYLNGVTSSIQTQLDNKASAINPVFTGAITATSFNSITGLSSTVPIAGGTESIGVSTTAARADHVHPVSTLSRGTYLIGSNYDGSAASSWSVDATDASTGSKVVARDSSGNFSANVITAVDFNTTSDARLKENIIPITDALNKVSRLNGVIYNLISAPDIDHVGLLAQDVLDVVPQAVTGSEDTQYSVSYGNLVGVLVEAIKELQARIILLEAK